MATEILFKKSLVVTMNEGTDGKGNPILKKYTYLNIEPATSVDNLVAAVTALSSLYEGLAFEFFTVDTNVLINN